MKSDFMIALTQLASERHLPREQVLLAVEIALASAFKKDSLVSGQNISVKLNPNSGEINVYATKTVVDDVEDSQREIGLEEAIKNYPSATIGQEVVVGALPHQMSRIAAQTAKQVVLQRLREVERELVYQEFANRIDDVVSGVVDQIESGRIVIVDLGHAQAILPLEEQTPTERYRKGQRLKVYILDVRRGAKGTEIIVSRNHKNLLKRLFEIEVPEVYNGIVEIKAIAREGGFRSKVAVASRQDGIDPVGSCIGMRGNRIQSIVNELQGEKIDVVRWDKDPKVLIAHALSPSEVVHVHIHQESETALVAVPERQLSLAIGKEGQNARLAAKLTNFRLDIKSLSEWESARALYTSRVDQDSANQVDVELIPETSTNGLEGVEPAISTQANGLEGVEPAISTQAKVEVLEHTEDVTVEQSVVEKDIDESPPEQVTAPDIIEEPGEVLETVNALSPEEELALLAIEEDQVDEDEDDDEDDDDELGDDVWEIPQIAASGAGQIRFSEDIMAEFQKSGRSSSTSSKKRGPNRKGQRKGRGKHPMAEFDSR